MNRVDPVLELLGIPTLWRRREDVLEGDAPRATPAVVREPSVEPMTASVAASVAAPVAEPTAEPAAVLMAEPLTELIATESIVAESIARLETDPLADLDFDALKARVTACTACRLCETRTQAVFGVGDQQADWMIVGEAPGANEDVQGEPFVGQAGKLLDNMFHALGLGRTSGVFIANVIKCRPPGNRDPQPDEVAACEAYLKRQIALVKPRIIVALGRFAAQTILRSEKNIGAMRGAVHHYEGVPVIVTYHPAYLLRSLREKAKAWEDLCLARATYRALPGLAEVQGDAPAMPSLSSASASSSAPNRADRG